MHACSLERRLGPIDAAAIVIANVIGVGIFTTPGLVATIVPNAHAIVAVWVAGGALAFFGALAYAELAARRPLAGGEYVYLRESFGDVAAFVTGWTSFVAGFPGAIAAGAESRRPGGVRHCRLCVRWPRGGAGVRAQDVPRIEAWGHSWGPAIFCVTSLAIVVNAMVTEPGPTLAGLGVMAGGLPIYWWTRARNESAKVAASAPSVAGMLRRLSCSRGIEALDDAGQVDPSKSTTCSPRLSRKNRNCVRPLMFRERLRAFSSIASEDQSVDSDLPRGGIFCGTIPARLDTCLYPAGMCT
jgi:hypothetical protein